ncbi:GDP-mannose 4,6-dehydratase [Acidiphilium sp.]|uniref:GDP-mannose 4,6-dehydratase n=1 Tax=Acidiphilium sp. TaxID=527 RepID=UPI00258D0B80|nr:GDP-mannose 4,6-dehydratase [Acidiphilium sp.]
MGQLRRILVTGAGGFVGRHLMPELGRRFPWAELVSFRADITDPAATETSVRDVRPDACVHLAGIAAIPEAREHPRRAFAVNLDGTLNLARALLAHAPGCQLIHAGSADCYGASFRSGQPLDESAPLAPLNTYAASKAAADLTLGAMAAESGLRVLRFRPFNHVGPGQSEAFALASFAVQLRRIARGDAAPVLHVGNLDTERDFLHVNDVVRAYALALGRSDDLPNGTIFNIASGIPRRMRDMVEAMIVSLGIHVSVEIDPTRLRPSDIPRAVGDASRAENLLGWHPDHGIEEIVRSVL